MRFECIFPLWFGVSLNSSTPKGKKQRKQRNSAEHKNPNWADILKMLIFGPGRSEIGLRTTIFGISVKNYTGFRNSRPNPWPGGLFRGRVKISTFFRRSASWFRRRIGTKGEKTANIYIYIHTHQTLAVSNPWCGSVFFRNAVLGSTKLWAPTVGAGATFLEGDLR